MPGNVPELAPLSPKKHRWEKSSASPHITQRRALGVEVVLGREKQNYEGHNDLHLLTSLTVANTTPCLSTLKQKLEDSLVALRFKRPECACTLAWDEGNIAPWIQYTPPEDHAAATRWAKEAVHIYASPKTGFKIWEDIENERRAAGYPVPEKPVSVHVVADVADDETVLSPGTTVDVLCKMNHAYWDGVSARSLVGDLLRELSLRLAGNAETPSYNWGEEVANLSVPVLDAMKLDIDAEEHEYIAARDEYMNFINDIYGNWGTRFHSGPPFPRVIRHIFSPEQSGAMIKAIKSNLGPKYTISHLGQAATALATMEANPPAVDIPEDEAFLAPFAINGRRWLDETHMQTYNGVSMTVGAVKFSNGKSLVVDKSDKKAIVKAMKQACEDTKASFDRWLNNPYQLAAGIAVHNFDAKFLSENPMPFKDVACPVFLSDGVNDKLLPKEILGGNSNEVLMTVDNFIFYLNELNPFYVIRLESWQGASTLSSTYNGGNYTQEEAEAFLNSVVYYMKTFAEEA